MTARRDRTPWRSRRSNGNGGSGLPTPAARGLTIAALAIPLLKGWWRSAAAAGAALIVAHQLCKLAKHATSEVRPDASDDQSFPSSHALDAFAAATSLLISAGPSIGLPALAGATFIAEGRLKADRHHPHDVIAGAGASVVAAYLAATLVRRVGERAAWYSAVER